mgnify:CR=1 FL=1
MKLIKFTSILLCFLMITAMFAGCDTPEESTESQSEYVTEIDSERCDILCILQRLYYSYPYP